MSAFQWQFLYDADASQTVTVTVAGEESGTFLTADHTFVVDTPNLASFIEYSGAYGTTLINDVLVASSYPTVSVYLPQLVAGASGLEADFHGAGVTFNDHAAVQQKTLAGMFKNLAGDFGISGAAAFSGSYPVEAVVGVSYGAVTADGLTSLVSPETGSTGGSLPVVLWENLLAAGKISDATLTDGDGGGGGGGTGSPDFAQGDSLSVFVRYTLAKERLFVLDGAGGGATASFTINGVSIGSTGEQEFSTLEQTVEWKFMQTL